MGFEPSWQAVAEGARPETQPPDEFEPGGVRRGWQHEAASQTEEHFREVLFDTVSDRDRALIRSQAGPGAGVALRVAPTSRLTSIQPHLFRVVLFRRLRLPLSLPVRICKSLANHCATCGRAGVLGRGFVLESAVTRICRAGRRCLPRTTDVWKLLLTVFLFSEGPSSQLTRFSCVRCIATVLLGAAERDGVVLETARRRKERRHLELVGPRS